MADLRGQLKLTKLAFKKDPENAEKKKGVLSFESARKLLGAAPPPRCCTKRLTEL